MVPLEMELEVRMDGRGSSLRTGLTRALGIVLTCIVLAWQTGCTSLTNDNPVFVVRSSDGGIVTTLDHRAVVASAAFSPDAKLLAVATRDGEITLWELPTGEKKRVLHGVPGKYGVVSFVADGTHLSWNVNDESAPGGCGSQLWRVVDGVETDVCKDSTRPICISPDGRLLARSGGTGRVDLVRIAHGAVLGSHPGDGEAAFSPDSRLLAIGESAPNGAESSIRIRRTSDGQPVSTLKVSDASFGRIIFSPDGKMLTTYSAEASLFNITDGRLVSVLKGTGSVVFSPDSRYLAARATDGPGVIAIWRVHDGSQQGKLTVGQRYTYSSPVGWRSDGTLFADSIEGRNRRSVSLWNTRTGKEVLHLDQRRFLALTRDASLMAITDADEGD